MVQRNYSEPEIVMKKTLITLIVIAGTAEAVEWAIELATGRPNVVKNLLRKTAKAPLDFLASLMNSLQRLDGRDDTK